MALKISSHSLPFNTKKISRLFSKYYSYVLLLIIIGVCGFALFITYTTVYDTLIIEKTINPTDIQSKEEKINLQLYTNVSKLLGEKLDHKAPPPAETF